MNLFKTHIYAIDIGFLTNLKIILLLSNSALHLAPHGAAVKTNVVEQTVIATPSKEFIQKCCAFRFVV